MNEFHVFGPQTNKQTYYKDYTNVNENPSRQLVCHYPITSKAAGRYFK
jgi:hypothetical protein